MKKALLFLLMIAANQSAFARTVTITNQCSQKIWVGMLGTSLYQNGGWELDAGQTNNVTVPDNFSGRFWPRTECDFSGTNPKGCATGDCGSGRLQCNGTSGAGNVTLAEITMSPNGTDIYDVSLVDAFNIPLSFGPVPGSYSNNNPGSIYSCGTPTCSVNLDPICPSDEQVKDSSGTIVACLNTSGDHGQQPNSYSEWFKNYCPTSYSWPYDDPTSTFGCQKANYQLVFCPSGPAPTPVPPSPVPSPTVTPTPSPTVTPAPTNPPVTGFTQSVTPTGSTSARVSFIGASPAQYVILHYNLNGTNPQNIQMQGSNLNWAFTVNGLKSGDALAYSFTYKIGNAQQDSPVFNYTFGSPTPSPSPTPTVTPVPTPTPTVNPGQDFTQSVVGSGNGSDVVTFIPSKSMKYVILHYNVNNASPQNVQMTLSGSNYVYTISGLKSGSNIVYSFTYFLNGFGQKDSQKYNHSN